MVQLEDGEVEMLVLAGKAHGEIQVIETDQAGEWVRVGARDFLDRTDPSVAAQTMEYLGRLQGYGLVVHVGGHLYRLTGTGWRVAREALSKSCTETGEDVCHYCGKVAEWRLRIPASAGLAGPQTVLVDNWLLCDEHKSKWEKALSGAGGFELVRL